MAFPKPPTEQIKIHRKHLEQLTEEKKEDMSPPPNSYKNARVIVDDDLKEPIEIFEHV